MNWAPQVVILQGLPFFKNPKGNNQSFSPSKHTLSLLQQKLPVLFTNYKNH